MTNNTSHNIFKTPPPIGEWAGEMRAVFTLPDGTKEDGIVTWDVWDRMKEVGEPYCLDTSRSAIISVFMDRPCRVEAISCSRDSQRVTISCVLIQ